jgi:hypothetical protein
MSTGFSIMTRDCKKIMELCAPSARARTFCTLLSACAALGLRRLSRRIARIWRAHGMVTRNTRCRAHRARGCADPRRACQRARVERCRTGLAPDARRHAAPTAA